MWWMLQILACSAIVTKQTIMRVYGFSFLMLLAILGILIVSESAFWVSMRAAPNFFKPWFFSMAALSTLGFIVSLIFFKEHPTPLQWTGAALAITGAFMLIKG